MKIYIIFVKFLTFKKSYQSIIKCFLNMVSFLIKYIFKFFNTFSISLYEFNKKENNLQPFQVKLILVNLLYLI